MTTRSTILVNVGTGDFEVAEVADALDRTNDHRILDGESAGKMILIFHVSAAAASDTITVVAGTDNDPAFRSGLGDLVYSCEGGAVEVVLGPIESARYVQTSGEIHIDLAGASLAGTVEAFQVE
jgi:hypothetical protein